MRKAGMYVGLGYTFQDTVSIPCDDYEELWNNMRYLEEEVDMLREENSTLRSEVEWYKEKCKELSHLAGVDFEEYY